MHLTIEEATGLGPITITTRLNGNVSKGAMKLVALRYSLRTNGAGMLGTPEENRVFSLARTWLATGPTGYLARSWRAALPCAFWSVPDAWYLEDHFKSYHEAFTKRNPACGRCDRCLAARAGV